MVEKILKTMRRTPNRGYNRNKIYRHKPDFIMGDSGDWLIDEFGEFTKGWMHLDINGESLNIQQVDNFLEIYGLEWTFTIIYGHFKLRFDKLKEWNIEK